MKNLSIWFVVLALFAFGFVARDMFPPRVAHAQASQGSYHPVANGWNISSVSSGSAVFTTNLTMSYTASAIRLDVTLGSTATLAIYETDGTHAFTTLLNGGTALTANCRYTFVAGMRNANAGGGGSGNGAVTQSGVGGATVTNGFTQGVTPYQFNFVVGAPTTVPELRCDELTSPVD